MFTRVYHGSGKATNVLLGFMDRAKAKIDSVVSYAAPSVIIETDAIREKRYDVVRRRGVKLRYVTEITRDNIDYVREMLSFSEIRHLDGIRGNFEVADEREYVAVATLQKAQPIPQLIFSNIPEIVEQQQFMFDSFWKMAIPAKQRIREIEHGVIRAETIVYSDYHDALKKEIEMIRNAKREIQIMYSTANAFHIQEKDGTMLLLREMAEQNESLRISILTPIDSSVRESPSLKLLRSYSHNIIVQDIAPSISIKIKSLVVDRRESLVMELIHIPEEKTTAMVGFSFYSNSESTVLSYASIFEVLYNQSILFEQLKQEDHIKSEFINIAAHELRTPIMPILNGMEILEEKLGDKVNECRREVDIITRNASRLQNLAESILQVSRIESGTFRLSVQSGIDIHSLIAQVIEDIEKKYSYTDKAGKVSIVFLPLHDREGVKEKEEEGETANSSGTTMGEGIDERESIGERESINAQAPPPPPKQTRRMENRHTTGESTQNDNSDYDNYNSTVRPLYVDCDSPKIAQVIFNLLDNAMKFTFDGKICVSTTNTTVISGSQSAVNNRNSTGDPKVGTTGEGKPPPQPGGGGDDDGDFGDTINSGVLVTVWDTGEGINNQIKDQLFEKFATKSRQGTGLGLYLSKKIIESHGGTIWYEEPIGEYGKDAEAVGIGNSGDEKKIGTVFKFVIPVSISKKNNVLKSRTIKK
jgi:signal transduction histidine kinase